MPTTNDSALGEGQQWLEFDDKMIEEVSHLCNQMSDEYQALFNADPRKILAVLTLAVDALRRTGNTSIAILAAIERLMLSIGSRVVEEERHGNH